MELPQGNTYFKQIGIQTQDKERHKQREEVAFQYFKQAFIHYLFDDTHVTQFTKLENLKKKTFPVPNPSNHLPKVEVDVSILEIHDLPYLKDADTSDSDEDVEDENQNISAELLISVLDNFNKMAALKVSEKHGIDYDEFYESLLKNKEKLIKEIMEKHDAEEKHVAEEKQDQDETNEITQQMNSVSITPSIKKKKKLRIVTEVQNVDGKVYVLKDLTQEQRNAIYERIRQQKENNQNVSSPSVKATNPPLTPLSFSSSSSSPFSVSFDINPSK
jgi:hypothetical protein